MCSFEYGVALGMRFAVHFLSSYSIIVQRCLIRDDGPRIHSISSFFLLEIMAKLYSGGIRPK